MPGTTSPASAGGRQFRTFSQGRGGQRGGGMGHHPLCSAALVHPLLPHLAPIFHPPLPSRHGRQGPICGHFPSHMDLKPSTIFLGKGGQALHPPAYPSLPGISQELRLLLPRQARWPLLRNDHSGPPASGTHGPLSPHLPIPPFPATTSGLINSSKSAMSQGLIRLKPH